MFFETLDSDGKTIIFNIGALIAMGPAKDGETWYLIFDGVIENIYISNEAAIRLRQKLLDEDAL